MFESLTQKLTLALGRLTSRGHLTEEEINEGLRAVSYTHLTLPTKRIV